MEDIIQNVPLNDRFDQEKFIGQDVDSECYDRMPVLDFGLSLLQKMGWSEERGIGLNPVNQLKKPIEFVPRHHRLGLGADPLPSILQSKLNGKTDQNIQNKNLVSKTGKNYNFIGDQLVEKKQFDFEINNRVEIVDGQHSSLQGYIISINQENKSCKIELDNGEKLKIQLQYIKQVDDKSEKNQQQKLQQQKNGDKKKLSEEKSDQDQNNKQKSRSRSRSKEYKKDRKEHRNKVKWVQPHIRVRVLNKELMQGKLYNTKVVVNDIIDKYTFSIVTPNGQYIDTLKESEIETVIPELEKRVIILFGKYKGKDGILKERNKKLNKVIVQISDDLELYECTQDDISQLVE